MAIKATPPPGSMTQKQAKAQGLQSFQSMTICRKGGCDTFHRYTVGFHCMACKARQDARKEATKEARQAAMTRRRSEAQVKAWARRRAEAKALEAEQAKRQAAQAKAAATRAANKAARLQQAQATTAAQKQGPPWDAPPDALVPVVGWEAGADLCGAESFDCPPW